MINILLGFTNSLTSINALIAQTHGEFKESGTIGIIVLSIIIAPVIILTTIALLEKPINLRVSGLFLGTLFGLMLVLIAAFAAGGFMLGFVVPG